jgi:hypothetical protein
MMLNIEHLTSPKKSPQLFGLREAENDGSELDRKRKQNIAARAYEQHKWRE